MKEGSYVVASGSWGGWCDVLRSRLLRDGSESLDDRCSIHFADLMGEYDSWEFLPRRGREKTGRCEIQSSLVMMVKSGYIFDQREASLSCSCNLARRSVPGVKRRDGMGEP